MPVQYSGILDEHNTVRTAAGLFDVSHMGELEVRGPQALELVDYVSTNNAAKLAIGQVHYSGLLYEHGGFVDDILVHKVADDHFFLCVNASNQDKDFAHIAAANRWDCTVENSGPKFAQIAMQTKRLPPPQADETVWAPSNILVCRWRFPMGYRAHRVPARTALVM